MVSYLGMTIKFTGKILKTNHMLISEFLHLFENLKFEPQVSNFPTVLACSSIDNKAMLYVWSLNVSVFKNLNLLHEIHVQEIRKETHRSV